MDIPVQITEEMLPQDRWIESVEYRNVPETVGVLPVQFQKLQEVHYVVGEPIPDELGAGPENEAN